MHLISSSIKPTPTDNLPILSGIAPPYIRREKLAQKGLNPDSLVPSIFDPQICSRLNRKHFASEAPNIITTHPLSPSWTLNRWKEAWSTSSTRLPDFIETPSFRPTGWDLPRGAWVQLNRLRTGCGRNASFLHRIGATSSNLCQCGRPQTINHIIRDCPDFRPPKGGQGLMDLDENTIT